MSILSNMSAGRRELAGGPVRVLAQRLRAIPGPLLPAPPHAFVYRFVAALAERAPESLLQQAVSPVHELLEGIVDVGEGVIHSGVFLGTQLEPGRLGLVLHPSQREI